MADGAPVPGAIVRVWRKIYPGEAGVPPRLMGTWRTDDEGRVCAFIDTADVKKRSSYACRFMAVHPTIPGLVVTKRNAIAPPDSIGAEPGWTYEIVFEDSAPGIEGIVVDAENRPIDNAIVDWVTESGDGRATLRHRSATDGRFAIHRHQSLSHLRVQAKLHQPRIVLLAESQASVHVTLQVRPHIVGRVVDERGAPVPRASVCGVMFGENRNGETPRPSQQRWDYWLKKYAFSESGDRDSGVRTWAYQRTETMDGTGRFSFPFSVAATARVVVKAEGYETVYRDLDAREGHAEFGDVVLRRSVLRGEYGTLLLPGGGAAANAKIVFTRPPLDERQVRLGSRVTDKHGRFSLEGLPEGEEVVLGIRVKTAVRGTAIQRVTIRRGMVVQY